MKKVTPVDEWQDAVLKHIKLLNEEEKREFAHKLIFDIALEVGNGGYERIGILEVVKLNLLEYMNTPDCDGDCDNCVQNKH
jgi:hypothetical protein